MALFGIFRRRRTPDPPAAVIEPGTPELLDAEHQFHRTLTRIEGFERQLAKIGRKVEAGRYTDGQGAVERTRLVEVIVDRKVLLWVYAHTLVGSLPAAIGRDEALLRDIAPEEPRRKRLTERLAARKALLEVARAVKTSHRPPAGAGK
jgi:hypothetical protein